MKKRLIALGIYSAFWLVFFWFARLFFILTHHAESFRFRTGTLISSFIHGLKLDISATAYVLAIPLLASAATVWAGGKWFRLSLRFYTMILLLIAAAIVVGDSVLYTYWGFRMDYTVLLYLKTPQEAAASVTTARIVAVFLTVIAITLIFTIIYNRRVDILFSQAFRDKHRLPATFLLLILTGALIIPVRGGLGVAPVNAGSVYFSKSLYVNHTAINVVWNVGSSLFNSKPQSNPYQFGDQKEAELIVDSLTVKKGIAPVVLNTQKPNILIIILESFGNSLVGPLGGDPLTTPRLNKLASESLLFTNFYASGNRTDKALPAILNGYPAQPAVSIIKEPKKSQSLPGLVKIMDSLMYNTSFWYGGDINFANFNSFVISSGFREIVTMENFHASDYNSKWGVHDHVFLSALRDSMKVVREPFFRVILTLSSHEPFEVPMEPVFQGKDDLTKFKNSVWYADRSVGDFIDWAKTTGWWKNTLVILVADHCRRNSLDELVYSPSIFRIPMLWTGGALTVPGRRIQKLGSQVDIPMTLLSQLGLPANFPFGKDLLSNRSESFAFYTFNEGFSFINETSSVVYDHKLGKTIVETGTHPEEAEKAGKAYLQILYDDYLRR